MKRFSVSAFVFTVLFIFVPAAKADEMEDAFNALNTASIEYWKAQSAVTSCKSFYADLVAVKLGLTKSYLDKEANMNDEWKAYFGGAFGTVSSKLASASVSIASAEASLAVATENYTKAVTFFNDGFYQASILNSTAMAFASVAAQTSGTDPAEANLDEAQEIMMFIALFLSGF